MVKIREIERKDLITIRRWHNDPALYQKLGGTFRYCNEETESEWFDRYMRSRNSNVRCVITDENDKVLGCIYLLNIDHINQSADLSILIGDPEYRRKGIGTFAFKAMLDHAFFDLNLIRVQEEILSTNTASISLAEKIGFKQEGIRRKAYYNNGEFTDAVWFSILKDEYIEKKSGTK